VGGALMAAGETDKEKYVLETEPHGKAKRVSS